MRAVCVCSAVRFVEVESELCRQGIRSAQCMLYAFPSMYMYLRPKLQYLLCIFHTYSGQGIHVMISMYMYMYTTVT